MDTPSNGKKKVAAIVGLLVIVVVIGVGVIVSNQSQPQADLASTPSPGITTEASPSASPGSSEEESATTSAYKDGTYEATGSYVSPGGNQTIKVSLMVKDGAIADANTTAGASDRTSQEYQGKFISGYKAQVVGKQLDEVNLSRVSGSSLTSRGFNDALNQIKNQAKA